MTTPNLRPSHTLPLRLGSTQEFARLRSLLAEACFDEPTICRSLKLEAMDRLGTINPQEADLTAAGSERLALLIRMFLFLEAVPRAEVERLIDPATLRCLVALDLLRPGQFESPKGSQEVYYSSVLLYPVAGLLIASDRYKSPDGSPFVPPPDAVFPAIYSGTLRFLKLLPKSPVLEALDLCAGSGIGALALSPYVKQVVASDITARATHFMNFNRLLNQRFNVEVKQGDLYTAVAGRSFDRIVAHPPYVPSLSNTMIFRDGGESGEELTRRIIAGLPSYLRSGGLFFSLCAGWDANELRFEQRARSWLGEAQAEFDILLAVSSTLSPGEVAQRLATRHQDAAPLDAAQWEELFRRAGMQQLVYGALVIYRRLAGSDALTARYQLSESSDGACFEWAFGWHHWRARKEASGELLSTISGLKLRLSPHLLVKVTHVVQDGALLPAEFIIESSKPFLTEARVDPWMASALSCFDGERTTAEIYEAMRSQELLPEALGIEDFIKLVARLIERGCLEMDEPITVN